jgi:hypothetical protein
MNIRMSTSFRTRRLLSLTALGGVLLSVGSLSTVATVQAQQGKQGDMFNHTADPKVVTAQVRSALPTAIEGLELLVAGGDTRRAVSSINDTYRYLRAAEESILLIQRNAKYPDPLAPVYAKRMWEVRAHMLKCLDIRESLTPDNPENVAKCVDELIEGIRKLRILVTILP